MTFMRKSLTAVALSAAMFVGGVTVANSATLVDSHPGDGNIGDLDVHFPLAAFALFSGVGDFNNQTAIDTRFQFSNATVVDPSPVQYNVQVSQSSPTVPSDPSNVGNASFGITNLTIDFFDFTALADSDGAGGITLADDITSFTLAALAPFALGGNVFTDSNGTQTDAVFTGFWPADHQIIAVVTGGAFKNASAAADPRLDVQVSAVPLPAPVVLLISALVGLGFLGRRRTRV